MNRLVDALATLPGIGARSAQRIAFHLLKTPASEAEELARAIVELKKNTRQCDVCFNLTDAPRCPICSDPRRDASTVLVVEQPTDVASFEALGMYKGVYHVLMGRLSPLDGLGAGELTIDALLRRVVSGQVREVILGTHPTLEGDGTALYLVRELAASGVRVTRLARGVPTGYSLDLASKAVLADAIHARQPMTGD